MNFVTIKHGQEYINAAKIIMVSYNADKFKSINYYTDSKECRINFENGEEFVDLKKDQTASLFKQLGINVQ